MNFRPRLVLAYADSVHAALSCRHLRRLGWEVHLASSGNEARRLVRLLAPQVVVLDTELREESGWLTCAKLKMEYPHQKVLLVAEDVTDEARAYADFVGAAALVSRTAGVPALLDRVQQSNVSAA
jgi:DNA-binding response OmpR family regulator